MHTPFADIIQLRTMRSIPIPPAFQGCTIVLLRTFAPLHEPLFFPTTTPPPHPAVFRETHFPPTLFSSFFLKSSRGIQLAQSPTCHTHAKVLRMLVAFVPQPLNRPPTQERGIQIPRPNPIPPQPASRHGSYCGVRGVSRVQLCGSGPSTHCSHSYCKEGVGTKTG